MNTAVKILTNGYIPIIPILAWNMLFISKLPSAFDPKSFNRSIPFLIIVGENLFRVIIFILPLFFRINISTSIGKTGLTVFIFGTLIYFSSWLLLIFFPDSTLSASILGFTAPAYTPLIWLIGLSLMVDSYYFKFPYSKWHYILPSIMFSFFHIYHTVYVYDRI
jgi:hypothetical protein